MEGLISASAPLGRRAIAIDGAPTGCRASISHWRSAPQPALDIAADTSTAMVIRAAADPQRWFGDAEIVVNDHADADGLLAMAACIDPITAQHHSGLLIAAAEAGDFSVWTGADGLRLMLLVHRVIAAAATPTAAVQQIAAELAGLIAHAEQGDAELDLSVRVIETALERLAQRDRVSIRNQGELQIVRWAARGRIQDPFGAVRIPPDDEFPVWALSCVGPLRPQCLIVDQPDGMHVWVDAPRYAWARTVQRPAWAGPELAAVADALQQQETGRGRWLVGDAAKAHGFSCMLACGDGRGGSVASLVGVGQIIATLADPFATADRPHH